jgi:C4-dicarboxylate-specific signal transduction histidine kinase
MQIGSLGHIKKVQCFIVPQFTWSGIVTEFTNLQSDTPSEASIPCGAASLESILCTEELLGRLCRPPEHETENSALAAMVSALADSPRTILQTLANKVLEILRADSAGLSLLTKDRQRFYWAAIAGAWQPHIGSGTPRNFGPCGDVLDHNIPMLFSHWERRYPYLSMSLPLADEGLLVPFYVNGTAVGTIWAIAHSTRRKFDAEDLRLLESMSRFASAAYQAVVSIEDLKLEIATREAVQTELRELTDSLETQVRVRTEELEQRNKQLAEARERLAEEKLRLERSEAFLAEGQRLSRIGSFCWHVATDEITWSEELYRIFEFDPHERVTLQLISTRVHSEDMHLMNDMVRQARAAARDFEYEHRLQMPDRSVKCLRLVAHGTRDKDGRLEYIGAIQDVTQHRLSEDALAKARSELAHVTRVTSLGELSASIAHEVNQPLSGIKTNASACLRMLAADPPNADGARETARRMIRDVDRASDVITRLRGLFGKKDTATDSVDLNEAAEEVVALSLSQLQRNRVILRMEPSSGLPSVIGDRVQLQQVILNLLLNASDAMSVVDDRPRQLAIRTERDGGDRVQLSVQDTGVGFDPQNQDKLFRSFYSTKSGGMGIGLSVSRSIIESHHGYLSATLNSGPGSTFAFSIPCRPE